MVYDTVIELDEVTLEDCIDLYKKKNVRTVINDGKIINFEKEWWNILILVGKAASGKDSVVRELVENHNYKKLVTYTTRPMRNGEKQDITYHYISEKEFKNKIQEEFFAEWKSYNTKFGTWYYGSALECR